MNPRSIHALSRTELAGAFQQWNQPVWRLDQLIHWLYEARVGSWEEMTNLPKSLRATLAANFVCSLPSEVRTQGSTDTTQKILWRLRDGSLIESVVIPANPTLFGDRADRHTLCLSTQVGCAYGCRFCASGLEGWKRNLTADEMVGQVLAAERHQERARNGLSDSAGDSMGRRAPSPTKRWIDNLVIMGMGEPLANYDSLLKALRILNAPWGGGIGARKITVSTSGLAPQIRKLADEPEQFRLAISLHGATDEVRNQIMPVNRKYPLPELVRACEYYVQHKGRMISLEYILLANVNDDPSQVVPLASLARRLHAKVNVIPYNTVEGLPWSRPSDARCEAFTRGLERAGVTATLRMEKGHDIDAACGQLRLKTEKELRNVASDVAPASPALP